MRCHGLSVAAQLGSCGVKLATCLGSNRLFEIVVVANVGDS